MVCDGTAVTASGARQVQTGAVGFDSVTRVCSCARSCLELYGLKLFVCFRAHDCDRKPESLGIP